MVKCLVEPINDNGRYAIMFNFDDAEAKGIIIVRPVQYGLEIVIPALGPEAVAFVDLFHSSPVGQDSVLSRGKPEVHLFDPAVDEPAVVASFLEDGRMAVFINGQMQPQERRVELDPEVVDIHTEFVFPEE